MERILVTGAANIGKAGVATIVYNWGQEFDTDILVYDYLMQSGLPDEQFQKAIEKKGGKMHTIDGGSKDLLTVIKWIEKIIRENGYQTLHINSDTAYVAAVYIYIAKKTGIRNIYVHSHCTQVDDANFARRKIKTLLHKFCRSYVCGNTRKFLACSRLAGEWMFGEKNVNSGNYQTIYNGVEVEKYLYDAEARKAYRGKMGLGQKYVIGCIGRFSYQKNHGFLIDMFVKYVMQYPDSVLMLVGDGELRQKIETKIEQAGIRDKVIFLGLRKDVPALLSVMDVMVMPSYFEGLPVTMVEAQMASLPCVVSSNITNEAKFTDHVEYIEGYDIDVWIKALTEAKDHKRKQNREEKLDSLFNIRVASSTLREILLG
jgi:glycosyltransferase EpsF